MPVLPGLHQPARGHEQMCRCVNCSPINMNHTELLKTHQCAVDGMLLHYDKHGRTVRLWVDHTHRPSCCYKYSLLIVYSFAAENSAKYYWANQLCLFLFKICCCFWKITRLFWKIMFLYVTHLRSIDLSSIPSPSLSLSLSLSLSPSLSLSVSLSLSLSINLSNWLYKFEVLYKEMYMFFMWFRAFAFAWPFPDHVEHVCVRAWSRWLTRRPPLYLFSDVNECEMSLALCGEALCENVDGSFLCICPNDNEEFDPITSQCRSLGNRAAPALIVTHRT